VHRQQLTKSGSIRNGGGGGGNRKRDGNKNGKGNSNDINADADNGALMTASRTTHPGNALQQETAPSPCPPPPATAAAASMQKYLRQWQQ
jgi:hypothetical protein